MTPPRVDSSRPSQGAAWWLVGALVLAGALAIRSDAQTGVRFSITRIPTDVGEDSGVQSMVLADVNDDDRDDLVSINRLGDLVLVYLAREDGSFEDPKQFAPLVDEDAINPTAVAVGDVASPFESEDDGAPDGIPDIVVASEDDGSIAILVGTGGGEFASREEAIDPDLDFVALALADMNDDTDLDIVALDVSFSVLVLLNEDGNFDPDSDEVEVDVDEFVDVGVGDIDGDDDLDVVALDRGGSSMFLLVGDGEGGLTFSVERPTDSDPADSEQMVADLEIADLNDDEAFDVAFVNSGQLGTDYLAIRNGPNLSDLSAFAAPFGLFALTLADFNQSGDLDALTAGEDPPAALIADDGAGGFINIGGVQIGQVPQSRAVASGDINNDGRPDFVALNVQGNEFFVGINGGATGGTPSPGAATNTPGPTGTRTATRPTSTITPTATQTPRPTVPFSSCQIELPQGDNETVLVEPVALRAADVDGNETNDLIVADRAASRVYIVLLEPSRFSTDPDNCRIIASAGPPSDGPASYRALTVDSPIDVATGDLTQTGTIDLAVAGTQGLSLFFGDGTGGFGARQPVADAEGQPISISGARAVAIARLDEDTNEDIVVAEHDLNRLTVLKGLGGGAFATAATLPVNGPFTIVAEDLDKDGEVDLAVASDTDPFVVVYFSPRQFMSLSPIPAATSTPTATPTETPTGSTSVTPVETSTSTPVPSATATAPSGATATPTRVPAPDSVINAGGFPAGLAAADFNEDNATDLIVTRGPAGFVTLLATRAGAHLRFDADAMVSMPATTMIGVGAAPFSRDDDSAPDVVVADRQGQRVLFYFQTDAGFDQQLPIPFLGRPEPLVVENFDDDRRMDVIVAGRENGALLLLRSGVLPNTPTPTHTFTATMTPTATPTGPTATPTRTPTSTETPAASRTPTEIPPNTPKPGTFSLSGNGCSIASGMEGNDAGFLLLPVALFGLIRARWRRVA